MRFVIFVSVFIKRVTYEMTFQSCAFYIFSRRFYIFSGMLRLTILRDDIINARLFAQNDTYKIALDYEIMRDGTTFLMHHFRS